MQNDLDLPTNVVRAMLEASDDCIKIIGLDGSLQFMSEGGRRVMEVDDFEALRGCPWPDFWQDQGNIDALAAIEAARAGKSVRFTGFAKTAKGNPRYWDVKVSPIKDDKGDVSCILSVSRDITALKLFEEEQFLLRNELSHRIKNVLALVQAIANQTLRDDAPLEETKAAFTARLVAMGQSIDQLASKNHPRAALRTLADGVASEHGERIQVDGPDVELSSRSALALALAFHELATNSVKYGALSVDEGAVNLSWTVDSSAAPTLRLTWAETGGPPVSPPKRRGFGTRMVERALTGYVHGDASISFERSGLVFTLSAPVAALAGD